mmetsp:Transcript_8389/g.9579  ORF Transcript_8389/g.9579 Transcript_8389/m.9579 type:complete len:146 (+) Transcript_8389:228-665(+)|eukprot:CAMPEP_0184013884 /NCGR_PEP_ID=MMETSP0954-20121128/5288_1 /TAXON_ID=627963 /ORGANISM="Aplanochytrium sp, Strain PBS07" /LENGTH=145 /DNA_ID=CAMNT_0026294177 /DNA_START=210 /DNA_END=647 /DNA_ORIENTATION=+
MSNQRSTGVRSLLRRASGRISGLFRKAALQVRSSLRLSQFSLPHLGSSRNLSRVGKSTDVRKETLIISMEDDKHGSVDLVFRSPHDDATDVYGPSFEPMNNPLEDLPVVESQPYEYAASTIRENEEVRRELHQKNPAIKKLQHML